MALQPQALITAVLGTCRRTTPSGGTGRGAVPQWRVVGERVRSVLGPPAESMPYAYTAWSAPSKNESGGLNEKP